MPNYGDRPNDYENVTKCPSNNCPAIAAADSCLADFYNKFGSVHQEFSANKERELRSKDSILTTRVPSNV